MQLQFYGAAGEVTGSCHILQVRQQQFLIDCGLIQGGRDAPKRNREPFPFNPEKIAAVFLTHSQRPQRSVAKNRRRYERSSFHISWAAMQSMAPTPTAKASVRTQLMANV
jgi:hypothetical protein